MRRLFYQTKIYDYTKITEADKHIKEMKEKGWHAKVQERDSEGNCEYVFINGQDEYKYSVEFFKEV